MAAAVGLLALQPVIGPDPAVLTLVMVAPAVGAGVARLAVRGGLPRSPAAAPTADFARSLALALLVCVLYFAGVAVLTGRLPDVPARVAGTPVLVMVGAQLLGSLGEEIGFRGLLLPGLMRWMPQPLAAVVVGALFGLWHVQYFGLPVDEHLAFLLGTVALTITMAYVMLGSFWQRMAACTVIHTGANLALAFAGTPDVSMTVFGLVVLLGAGMITPLAVLLHRRHGSVVG